jgi:hypothetical protein
MAERANCFDGMLDSSVMSEVQQVVCILMGI